MVDRVNTMIIRIDIPRFHAQLFSESKPSSYFDLESQPDLRRLQNPELILGSLRGIVILDEIQEMPELFRVLRVVADRPKNKARFLILGSASPNIIKNVSETLAGRVEFVELGDFNLQEVGVDSLRSLWLRGGFPRSFLAKSDEDSVAWRVRIHPDVSGAGHSQPWHCNSLLGLAPLLDHAGSLSRTDLERI